MTFENTAARVWKRLTREERLLAARHFWADPPREVAAAAQAVLVKTMHVRPQSVRTLSAEQRERGLGLSMDPGEVVAASLLVALHLGERRALLCAFLDAAGLVHENGLLPQDASDAAIGEDVARRACQAIAAAFPAAQVQTYLNTLWLQDHERWSILERVASDLP